MDFEQLYHRVLKDAVSGKDVSKESKELDCLFYPERYAAVVKNGACEGCREKKPCVENCLFDAVRAESDGSITIDAEKCSGCLQCVEACKEGKLFANKDGVAAVLAARNPEKLSYALIAPAFLGQFSEKVTPGKLRSAFRSLGFDGMIEVALFADILTMKEALEFDKNIVKEKDFQLTSCCCPIWIAMIRKIYSELVPHVPGSVSPMIAAGRVVKLLHPDAVTVFIGPCVAKKSEAREADLKGAVDYVLTFRETEELFKLAGIDPEKEEESEKDHSSRAGRIYASAGGVSEAVRSTVEQLNPGREIPLKSRAADGVPACRAMIEELKSGTGGANFYEGMGCKGGCVGGPKAILSAEDGRKNVERYGDSATYKTPLENPYVYELLKRLNISNVESLLNDTEIFTRVF